MHHPLTFTVAKAPRADGYRDDHASRTKLDDVIGIPALERARKVIKLPAVGVGALALEDLIVARGPIPGSGQGPRFHVAFPAQFRRR